MKNDDLAEISKLEANQAKLGSILCKKKQEFCGKYADFRNGDIVKLTRNDEKVYKCRIIMVKIADTCGGLCKINGFEYKICVHPTKDAWRPILRNCYTGGGDKLELWN